MSEGRRDLDTVAASISDRPASGSRASATGLLLPDRYVEPKRIASGGMGEIWRFRDARLSRDVVLKRLHTEAGGREETRLAFAKEAQLQASLGHPGIVSVFDLAEDELGQTYFTMQEVQGTTLADALESVPTSPSRSPWSRRALLEVLARVSLTVAFAHQRGVLHLDLKPENIMLGHFGEVYVLDWGIARRTSDAPQDAESSSQPGLTAAVGRTACSRRPSSRASSALQASPRPLGHCWFYLGCSPRTSCRCFTYQGSEASLNTWCWVVRYSD